MTKPTETSRGPNMGGLMYPISKQTKARILWRRHEQNIQKLAMRMLELLAHPQVTDEMIMSARAVAQRAWQGHILAVNKMRANGHHDVRVGNEEN